MSVMTVIDVLSFIPGGVGVSDAGIAELLIRTGHGSPASQVGALAIRFYRILMALSGGVHFLIWKIVQPMGLSDRVRKKQNDAMESRWS